MQVLKNGIIAAMVLLTAALAACDKKDSNSNNGNNGNSGQTVVQAIPNNINFIPNSSQCLNQTNSYESNWGPYQQAGFYQPVGSYGQYGQGRFGQRRNDWDRDRYHGTSSQVCPANTYPACDAQVGLVCVPSSYGQNNTLAWYGYNGSQFSFCGYNQYQGYSSGGFGNGYGGNCGTSGGYSGGYSPVGQTCLVGTNSCGYGQCLQIGGGSSIGICTQ
jgi:hypothetical protein